MIPENRYCRNRQERYRKVIVSGRKIPEIARTWKQYSGRKFFGFFPMISGLFLTEPT
jgi:hypothetical protein